MKIENKASPEFVDSLVKTTAAYILTMIGGCMSGDATQDGERTNVTLQINMRAFAEVFGIAFAGAFHTLIAGIQAAEESSIQTKQGDAAAEAGIDFKAVVAMVSDAVIRQFENGHTKGCTDCHADISGLSQLLLAAAVADGLAKETTTHAAASAVFH